MKSITPSKCLAVILMIQLILSPDLPGVFAATTDKDFNLDDNTGDSPSVAMKDQDDKTFTLLKLDAGGADVVNNEGDINFKPSGDTDDYLSVSTASNASYLYWLGVLTYTNDPGLRVNATTGKLEYRDEDAAGWTAFDDISGATNFGGLADVSFAALAQGDVVYYDGTNWVNLGAGSAGDYLQTQGSGANPRWATPVGTGALRALDNLASVAINTSLISDAANTDDLGTEANYWKKLYLAQQISFEGVTDNDFQTTLSVTDPTAERTITFPDATDTVTLVAVAQTLTNKTLTSPTIGTSPTAAGATWTDLGTVTTADINGGTIDGATIGGTTPATATVTTLTAKTSAVIEDPGAGTNTVTIQSPAALGASYSLTLPANDGDLSQVLTTNGAGALSWTDVSANAANKALSNLASVAINTSLISDTANTDDLGSEALYWKKLYLADEISFEGATDNDFQTTFSVTDPTADRTITFPNDTGTVLLNVVEDTTPQLGGMLDVNGNAIGDGTLELLKFTETASAVNELTITNAATAGAPQLSATGDDTNIDLKINAKGTGDLILQDTATGNVGIGAASPEVRLETGGMIRVLDDAPYPSTGDGLELIYDQASAQGFIGTVDRDPTPVVYTPLTIESSELAINAASGGNVGIGTTPSLYRVEVYPDKNGYDGIEVRNTNTGTSAESRIQVTAAQGNADDGNIQLRAYPAESTATLFGRSCSGQNALYTYRNNLFIGTHEADAGIIFGTSDTERMVIDYNGNVGIGAASPEVRLETGGMIRVLDDAPYPSTGDGLELIYDQASAQGFIGTVDRDPTPVVYTPLTIESSELAINAVSGGNVGIGTPTTTSKLEVYDTTSTYGKPILRASGVGDIIGLGLYNDDKKWEFLNITSGTPDYIAIRNQTAGIVPFFIYEDGMITMPYVYGDTVGATNRDLYIDSAGKLGYLSSSIRYKENIRNLDAISEKIYDLEPVLFDYKDEAMGINQFGLIAEEVATVIPEIVSYDEENKPETVSYNKLIPLLLNEIKKLEARVSELEAGSR